MHPTHPTDRLRYKDKHWVSNSLAITKELRTARAVPRGGHLGHLPQAQQYGGAKLGIFSASSL